MRLGYKKYLLLGLLVLRLTPAVADDYPEELVTLDSLLNIRVNAAMKYELRSAESPASISVLTADDIRQYGYTTLSEALAGVRGVYLRSDRNYEYLGIRGFSRPGDNDNRTLLLLNGQRLNENFYGSAFIGNDLGINLASVERIEFVRGPSSALYGSNAMFGVINIVTKKGQDIDGLDLNLEAGSRNTRRVAVACGNLTRRKLDLTLSLQAGDSGGEELYFAEFDSGSTDGIAQNLDWERFFNFHTTLHYRAWKMEVFYNDRLKGIPTAAWGMEFNNADARSRDRLGMLNLVYDKELDFASRLTLRTFYNHYLYEGVYPYAEGNWWDANDCHWVGIEGQLRRDISAQNRLFCGAEYQQHLSADYRSWDADSVYFDRNFPYSVTSLFLQDELQVSSQFALITGMRYDQYSWSKGSLTPRIGVILNPFSTSTLKLLHGSAFRSPNVYEMHYADPGFAKGNRALKPEKITTSELIWEQTLLSVALTEIACYYYSMQNLIDQALDPADSLMQFENIAEVRAYGLEWGLRGNLKSGLNAYLNLNIQKAYDAESGDRLSNSPEFTFKAGISVPLHPQICLVAEGIYESGRYSIRRNRTPDYFLCNAGLRFANFWRGLSCSLRVRNLFDSEFMLPASLEHAQDLIVQPRRYVGVIITYTL